jgi:ATP-binding cassette subfamily B protein
MLKVPYFHQQRDYTCGPACLEMVLAYFGKRLSEKELAKMARSKPHYGTMHLRMIKAANRHRFYCYVQENSSMHSIKHFLEEKLPVIVHYREPSGDEGHYSLIIGHSKNHFIMNDPWNGKNFKISYHDFKRRWFDYQEGHKYSRWILVISKSKFSLGKQFLPRI